MSLPPGFLDELRDRLTLSDVVGRKVSWDRRKSNPARGDWWSPCPFHQEKTPSFHVEDRKGFYYCFGCQAKGDAITFVKETENLSFMEAVERLADEAGLEMPARRQDPEAEARRGREARLLEAMEEAVRLFGRAFRGGGGQAARDYARGRGLSDETLRRFEIGFAPDSRTALTEHFRNAGRLEEAAEAGLVIRPEEGGAPYDRFRNRLMFPIRDGRGRCIAFGGRALSPEARAKYLNSPETPLFHKGRTLYNMGPAREAAGKAGRLLVAEGYMDVIALVEAGFEAAVAPLGTAITEEQLALLWRMAPEPVIALDGDSSGLRAAHRLVELALPQLAPGRSLGFCLMPDGADPDDLLKAGGARAMEAAIRDAVPLVEMLWRRALAEGPADTPERRAALDARLRAALDRIGDQGVRAHYAAEIRRRRRALFATAGEGEGARARRGGRGAWRPGMPAVPDGPRPETRGSWLARGAPRELTLKAREAVILLLALRHPEAAAALEAELEEMPLATAGYEPVRTGLLAALAKGGDPLAEAEAALGADPLRLLCEQPSARAHPLAVPGAAAERVCTVLREAIARHRADSAAAAERAEAVTEFREAEGEDWTWRVRQAALERERIDAAALAERGDDEDTGPSLIESMLREGTYRRKKRRPPPSNQ